MMGILPLELAPGSTWQSVGLTGEEVFDFPTLDDNLKPRQKLKVIATSPDGKTKEFEATVRIDTPVELDYYRNGGILQTVLRKLLEVVDSPPSRCSARNPCFAPSATPAATCERHRRQKQKAGVEQRRR